MPAGKYIRTPDMFKRIPMEVRFYAKVLKYEEKVLDFKSLSLDQIDHMSAEEKGCHVWTGKLCLGYGRLWIDSVRRAEGAHRLAYELEVGPIPAGLEIDHLCRNRACVNSKHLEPISCGENILRGLSLQAKNKAKTHCKNGHEFTPENTKIRKRPGGGRKCIACTRPIVA